MNKKIRGLASVASRVIVLALAKPFAGGDVKIEEPYAIGSVGVEIERRTIAGQCWTSLIVWGVDCGSEVHRL
jgi:hypothetical protein